MKRAFVVFLAIMLTDLVAYLVQDMSLYYYGKSDFTFYNKLPLKIKPQYWGPRMGNLGFVLLDESEMTIISEGKCRYVGFNKEIMVKEIIRYGFSTERLIAEVQDTIGNLYLIEVNKNPVKNSKRDMTIIILDDYKISDYVGYKWFEMKDASLRNKEVVRNYLRLTLVVLLIVTFFFGLKWIRQSR